MKLIQDYSFHDGKILSVSISAKSVEVVFEKWDCKQIRLWFDDYRIVKDRHSIGQDIGELLINSFTDTMNELVEYILDEGGSKEETNKLKVYSFTNSFGNHTLLEIVALNAQVEELSLLK